MNTISKNSSIDFVSSPFWKSPTENKKITIKLFLKYTLKWGKILLFLFMLTMGLIGCFQSSFDSSISQNSNLGIGLEYGYKFGTTGNYKYDLQSASSFGQYSTFTNWSMTYGPFYAFFIWPAAFCITNFMYATKKMWGSLNALLAIFLLLLLIRGSTLAISLKSTLQNEKMTNIQNKIAQINEKYKGLNDLKSKQMKQYEIQNLYKKANVKPWASFYQMFLTMPIFLIIYRIVVIVRPIKASVLFNIWSFSTNPLGEIFSNFLSNGWTYIFLLLIIGGSQFMSMKLPQILSKKRSSNTSSTSKNDAPFNKNKLIQNVFIIFMCVIVILSPCGVGIYWCLSSIFTIIQSLILHKIILKKKQNKFHFLKINFDI